jgi:RNA polymerase sigma factor (TIGR02999 family)
MMNNKNITRLLLDIDKGDKSAIEQLFPVVYNQLRRMSENQLRKERKNHTINTTALIHEVYIKIAGKDEIDIKNRSNFFAIAAKCMRDILVDYARRRKAAKRGGDKTIITLNEQELKREIRAEELIVLDDVLDELQNEMPRVSKVVEMKFFAGLSYAEIAEALSVSVPTVRRDWQFAQAWLSKALC